MGRLPARRHDDHRGSRPRTRPVDRHPRLRRTPRRARGGSTKTGRLNGSVTGPSPSATKEPRPGHPDRGTDRSSNESEKRPSWALRRQRSIAARPASKVPAQVGEKRNPSCPYTSRIPDGRHAHPTGRAQHSHHQPALAKLRVTAITRARSATQSCPAKPRRGHPYVGQEAGRPPHITYRCRAATSVSRRSRLRYPRHLRHHPRLHYRRRSRGHLEGRAGRRRLL